MPLTDCATRLAYDIESGAKQLRASSVSYTEILHKPLSIPEGVKDPKSGGTLFIKDLENRKGWGTTYHLNYVRVPHALGFTKNAGESVIITLERDPDGKTDVTSLR